MSVNSANSLTKRDVADRLCCSVRQVEKLLQAGDLPKPFRLGRMSPRWLEEDISAWLRRKATEANHADELTT